METTSRVDAVHLAARHQFSKRTVDRLELLDGLGVRGDAHLGETVQHLHQRRKQPTAPNLRQVHLLPRELLTALEQDGFHVLPGGLGENITTVGIDLLELPRGTLLHLGRKAIVEVTGLRNPCVQIEKFQTGLLKKLVDKDAEGNVVRKAGIMAVVRHGGLVAAGDPIMVTLPAEPWQLLQPV